ncbi:MAG: ATP--guanido phosphotransferase [Synergistales bacterium]|nr:ATP--guanido phosphotransferase [Synergistales bacterium]
MAPEELIRGEPEWIGPWGRRSDVVLSCRIRLARNVEGVPFPGRATAGQLEQVAAGILEGAEGLPAMARGVSLPLASVPMTTRLMLYERRLVSREFLGDEPGRHLAVGSRGATALMLNEEDHLRIQVVLGGAQLDAAWSLARSVERGLGGTPFAYDRTFGYLSSCPTNVGTGLRASVMLHLPALTMTRQIQHLIHECQKVGLAVRGSFGEGTAAQGDLYQLSNQVTLGPAEEELTGKVSALAEKIVEAEREARRVIAERKEEQLAERIWRSWGVLQYAHALGLKEALHRLSALRLGGATGGFPRLDTMRWKELLLWVQPGHVQHLQRSDEEEKHARARIVRELLGRC